MLLTPEVQRILKSTKLEGILSKLEQLGNTSTTGKKQKTTKDSNKRKRVEYEAEKSKPSSDAMSKSEHVIAEDPFFMDSAPNGTALLEDKSSDEQDTAPVSLPDTKVY